MIEKSKFYIKLNFGFLDYYSIIGLIQMEKKKKKDQGQKWVVPWYLSELLPFGISIMSIIIIIIIILICFDSCK